MRTWTPLIGASLCLLGLAAQAAQPLPPAGEGRR